MSANPTRCTDSASWVWKTAFSIKVPYGVTPIPTAISTATYQNAAFGPTTTYTTAYLNPSDVPASSLSSRSSSLSYSTSWFEYSCTVPWYESTGLVSLNGRAYDPTGTGASATAALASATATQDPNNPWALACAKKRSTSSSIDSNGRYISGYYSRDDGYIYGLSGWGYYEWCDTNYDCACHRGLSWWALIPILVGSWIFLCLVAGMIESWFRFRNLCRGRSARRGLPIAWVLIMIPWTCFFLCCLKRGYTKKSPEEQALLTTQWKEMGAGKKLGRWLKWGFRYKYPTFLGQAPFRRTKWEEKDIAVQLEAQRRLSVNAAPMSLVPLNMVGQGQMTGPVVGQTPESYYKPQAPAQAYLTPGVGVAASDFAAGENRGIGRNRDSTLPSVAEGPSPTLPARPTEAVSPVSPIAPEQESTAGTAPKSPKGERRADLRGDPIVGA